MSFIRCSYLYTVRLLRFKYLLVSIESCLILYFIISHHVKICSDSSIDAAHIDQKHSRLSLKFLDFIVETFIFQTPCPLSTFLIKACLDLSVSSSFWDLGRGAVCDCGHSLDFSFTFFDLLNRDWYMENNTLIHF